MPGMISMLLFALAALPALLHMLAAAGAPLGDRDAAWRRAQWAALGSALAGAAAVAVVATAGPREVAGLRLDAAGSVVMLLVGVVGAVIVRFSHRYLQAEAGERRYLRLLCGTLAAVSLVLVADHLLLLAAAWTATSTTLHRLLRFYDDRLAARVAAHKKFLSARAADAALIGAVLLLATAYGTLSLGELLERAGTQGVPAMAQAGLVLLVATALLKCAQLPFHGWLIQVMEAPTPVSALLHAGVVNLGGLVLIRFSPMLSQSAVALTVLGTAATLTVAVATLVVGTRVSIKVALAWSTVGQMGFMLLQVALGLPAMALLHLVAHSLYKAHAFLSAGGIVQRQQSLRLVEARSPQPALWAVAATTLPAAVVGVGLVTGALATPSAWLAGAVLGLSLVPLAAGGRLDAVFALAIGWFAGHAVSTAWLAATPALVPLALPVGVAVVFALLFMLQTAILLRPSWAWVRRLYPWAYGGFYVDEQVSRLLLQRWPTPPGRDQFCRSPQ